MPKDGSYECIHFVQEGRKAFITFNRPEVLNALSRQLAEEALDAFARIGSETRVLVVRGSGNKAFSAGGDIRELQRERTIWSELHPGPRKRLAQALESAPFTTVAALNGDALGGGFEIALACHLRVATDHAHVGLPELRLGLIPGNGGTQRLPRLIGRARALQAILLGEKFDAQEAVRLGLVNWTVPAKQFDQHVSDLADRLAELPPVAVQAVQDCVVNGTESGLDDGLAREQRWFQICLASADKEEGVRAFLEKRRPNFTGIH